MLGMVTVTFRIWVALEFLQNLDNHGPQRFDFCIECTPADRTCQLYHYQVKIMFIYEGTNNLVSGAFLKCFSIVLLYDLAFICCQLEYCLMTQKLEHGFNLLQTGI